jgi:hypothetical protein
MHRPRPVFPCLHSTCGAVLWLLLSLPLFAQAPPTSTQTATVPQLVQFSGVIKDANGIPHRGLVGITFALYKEEQGDAPLWLETQNVTLDAGGHYTVMLGASTSGGLPIELFASKEARWLGIEPQGLPAPARVLLLSVPYALKAGDAETIGGLPPSAFVLAGPGGTTSGGVAPVLSGGTNPSAPPPAVSMNFIPEFTAASGTLGNSTLYQTGSGTSAKVGINTTSPATTLDVKGAATIRGSFTLPATATATATAGTNSQPLNSAASVFSSNTSTAIKQNFRWQAEPVGNNTPNPSASLNLLFATGSANPSETGLKISNLGVFTFAPTQTFPGAGTITGVTAGTDLTGGGTSGNVTLNLDTTKVMTGVVAGTGLTGGGTGGAPTLSLDTTKVPLLNTANTFTGNQTVTGNLTSTGVVSAASYQIGSKVFGSGNATTNNVYLGFAGNNTTTGYGNTAVGGQALVANAAGTNNTASGQAALPTNTSGSDNAAMGVDALENNTQGNYNTGIGVLALASNTTGSNNTALGYNAGPDPAHLSLVNATAIGANAVVSESNALVLGNGAYVGIGTATPAYPLHVNGIVRSELGLTLGGNAPLTVDAPGIIGGRLAVLANGNVGINNINPQTTLDVGGNINASGSLVGASLNVAGGGVINGGLTTNAGITTGAGISVGAGINVTGAVKINGDTPMNAAPHMSLTGYVPQPISAGVFVRPIFTIPSKNILITRMTSNGWNPCSSSGAETFTLYTGGQSGVALTAQYTLTLTGGYPSINDSGALSISIAAGTPLWVISNATPSCPLGSNPPGDIAISVEYVMQ